MKFYYVALTINPDQPVRTQSGKRLAYYLKKHEADKQCGLLNNQWGRFNNDKANAVKIYKVYCIESEPMEVTSD